MDKSLFFDFADIDFITKIKKIGGTHYCRIPKDIVNILKIKENDNVKVILQVMGK